MDFLKEIIRGKTLFRAMLLVALKDIFLKDSSLQGPKSVLEIGGQRASHERTYPATWQVTNSNYQKFEKVDIVVDANKLFPLKSGSFDGVTIFNTLYLVDDYMNCLKESLRVSKHFVLFNIPLISLLTPHPVDMNRFTYDRLENMMHSLKNSGLTEYSIIPLGGLFTSATCLLDPFLHFRAVRIPVYILAKILDKVARSSKYRCPSQYLVVMKK